MSAYLKKGVAVWILGFLTILAALNAFNAVLMWTLYDSTFEFEPYLIGQFTGNIQAELYFWISLVTTLVFLGCTAVMAFRKPPLDPTLVEMLVRMNDNIAANKTTLEEGLEGNMKYMKAVKNDLLERMEIQREVNEKFSQDFKTSLENTRKTTLNALEKQEKSLQKTKKELSSTLETNLSGVKEEVLGALAKQEEVIQRVARSSRKSTKTIEKATADMDDIRARLENLETTLAPPKPLMTSQSSTRDIKGVGPRLAEELKTMGINNAADILTADPAVIDEKTRLTRETAERLQGTVQLLMIPGINNTDVELLEKVDVTNRKELAEQDPFELYRELAEVARTFVEEKKISEAEKPTIEEVMSWVKQARL